MQFYTAILFPPLLFLHLAVNSITMLQRKQAREPDRLQDGNQDGIQRRLSGGGGGGSDQNERIQRGGG
jgi:hypothetical protein